MLATDKCRSTLPPSGTLGIVQILKIQYIHTATAKYVRKNKGRERERKKERKIKEKKEGKGKLMKTNKEVRKWRRSKCKNADSLSQ